MTSRFFNPVQPARSAALWVLRCAAIALVAAACGTGVGTGTGAVSVGDDVLARSEVNDYLLGWESAAYPESTGVVVPEVVQSGIDFWVRTTALEAELGDDVTADDRIAARQWVAENVGDVDPNSLVYDRIVAWRSTRLAIGRTLEVVEPTEQEIRERLEIINASQAETACAAHILVSTEAEANDVIALIDGGATMAELAPEYSLDPGSAAQGGDLGCVERGSFVAAFDEALFAGSEDDLIGPLQTEFGFHIIRHQGFRTTILEYDEVADELRELMLQERGQDGDAAHDARLGQAAIDADVTVDPRYGTWESDFAILVLPQGAEVASNGEPAATEDPLLTE